MADWHLLVEIQAAQTHRFALRTVMVTDQQAGRTMRYQGGIGIDSVPGIGEDGTCSLTIPTDILSAQELRRSGIVLGDALCRVSLWRAGDDYSARIPLVVGRAMLSSEKRYEHYTSFEIAGLEEYADVRFPPYQFTRDGFPNLPSGIAGQWMQVIYGRCKDVPLVPVEPNSSALSSMRAVIACHRLASSSILVRKDGSTDGALQKAVSYTSDPASGATYAYVTLTQAELQDFGATTLVADVDGKPGPGGQPLTGLGDVVIDAIESFGRLPADRIDWERLSRFRPRANAIQVASTFGQQPGGLVAVLQSRYGGSMPVDIGWRGGRLGADWLDFDETTPVARNLAHGRDLFGRIEPVEVSPSEPAYSQFEVTYDLSRTGGSMVGRLTLDETNDPRCAAAAARARIAGVRSGAIPYQQIDAVDIVERGSALVVAKSLVARFGVPRTVVRYQALLDTMAFAPLREKYLLTDDSACCGWTAEPFRLVSIGLNPANLNVCVPTFVSFRSNP